MPWCQNGRLNANLPIRRVEQHLGGTDFLLRGYNSRQEICLFVSTHKGNIFSFQEQARSSEPMLKVFQEWLQDCLQ
jgi:hypothetical protein